jgi:hypothetical protein
VIDGTAGPEQLRRDSWDGTAGMGQLGPESWNGTAGTGHLRQNSWDRTDGTKKPGMVSLDRSAWADDRDGTAGTCKKGGPGQSAQSSRVRTVG